MTAPRVPTILDARASRARWADLADSSQECSKDGCIPAAPLVDDSYDTPAGGVGDKSNDGLNGMFSSQSRVFATGPIDFSFLTDRNTAASSTSGPLSATATTFVPNASRGLAAQPSSPSMPPPAVPQAKQSRRIRGKRALSSVQANAPAEKRPKEASPPAGDKEGAATPQPNQPPQRGAQPYLEPPPASEEDWQHRIAKRVKVVTTIKETQEYQGYLQQRAPRERLDGEPRTPTAEDRSLSKRRWEYEIQQWRNQLKQWSGDSGSMLLDDDLADRAISEEVEEELSPAL